MAAALAQQGWSVTVHERDADLRELGAGIFIWPNGVEALRRIGALDDAIAGGSPIRSWSINDQRRRRLQGGPITGAYDAARPELQRSLADAALAAGAELRVGSTVVSADASGELVLDTGERRQADLVVGADGIGSRVRDSLGFNVTKHDLRYGSQRLLVPRDSEDPSDDNPEFWHRSWRIGYAPCGPDRLYVYMFCPPDDRLGRATPLNRDAWVAAFPHLARVLKRVPDQTEWREVIELQCDRWSTGRVVLVGDAAHAMAPNWGQGANSTMLSAVRLADELRASTDVSQALAAWESEHRVVVDRIQRYSRHYSNAMTRWPPRLTLLRSATVWAFGHSRTLQRRVTGLA
jgi:2-polyprenyl-6-methoxyphenol hydroxylase-like FAD-dependent oxidoreductase